MCNVIFLKELLCIVTHPGEIDQTLVYLSGILAVGTVASLLRQWLFTLAGIRCLSRFKTWVIITLHW